MLSNFKIGIAFFVVGLALLGWVYFEGQRVQKLEQDSERLQNLQETLDQINDANNAENAFEQCLALRYNDGLPVAWNYERPGKCIDISEPSGN